MKICYIISTVNVAGGANRSLLELLPFIVEAGHECTVLGCAHGSMEKAVRKLGAHYKVLPFSSYVKAPTLKKRIKRQIANVFGKYAIAAYFGFQRFSIVHNNSLPTAVGMDVAKLLNIPYICHIRENVWDGLGMEFYCPNHIKRIVTKASCVITISDYINRAYNTSFPNDNYIVMKDGINVDDYYSCREIFQSQIVRIGIIGVINPQKGQREAVQAIEILHEKGFYNIELDIIGDDGLWNGNRDYARLLRADIDRKAIDYIRFIPAIEDLGKLKKQRDHYDINLICSKAEGLGRTTIESMLSGALTIAADAGATPEIIKSLENGLLYKCGNARDLASKIEYAINHKEEMRKLAYKGQEFAAQEFSIDRYATTILQVYDSILSND